MQLLWLSTVDCLNLMDRNISLFFSSSPLCLLRHFAFINFLIPFFVSLLTRPISSSPQRIRFSVLPKPDPSHRSPPRHLQASKFLHHHHISNLHHRSYQIWAPFTITTCWSFRRWSCQIWPPFTTSPPLNLYASTISHNHYISKLMSSFSDPKPPCITTLS